MGYHDDVARMRQERAQRELQAEYNQHLYGRNEALRRRQEIEQRAAVETDPDEQRALRDQWDFYDQECLSCEQELRRLTPRQVTKEEQAMGRFMQRNAAFIEKHGQAALNAFDLAHRYATAPRNPAATNPANAGMGLRPGTRPYFRAMRDLLTLYGKDVGVNYDEGAEHINATEAANICGLDADTYNRAAQEMHRQGRFSYQQKK